MAAEQRKELIDKIQRHRGGSRVICCVTSDRNNAQGQIAKDFLPRLFEHLRPNPSVERLDIFLFTLGGDTLAAYALSRFVRQFANRIGVLVPHWCHSGGTLFSLGAEEIVMTRVATLSSIDPSIIGPLNPFVEQAGQKIPVPVGVESVTGFKNSAREDWGLDDEGTALAFRLLSERVNPLLIGDLYRSREQIVRLATNLMKLHRSDDDRIRNIVETLATRLGSHDYLITAREARQLMEQQVAAEDSTLEDLVWQLYEDFAQEMELGIPFNPVVDLQVAAQRGGQVGPIRKTLRIVRIESLTRVDTWERDLVIMPPLGQIQILWDYWR